MNKTIIALSGKANTGKSMTLFNLDKKLQTKGATITRKINLNNHDYLVILQYGNLTNWFTDLWRQSWYGKSRLGCIFKVSMRHWCDCIQK